jgi:hypothetical protein
MESTMLFERDAAWITHVQYKPLASKPHGVDLRRTPASGNICKDNEKADLSPQATFFHDNGSINYAAAIDAASVVRSRAFRAVFQLVWRGMKHAAFRVLSIVRR